MVSSDPLRCPTIFFVGFVSGRAISMRAFANALSRMVGRPVVNKTGLDGEFDLDLEYLPDFDVVAATPPPGPARPSLFTALQEQLGLKLEPGRGDVAVLMVDRLEHPTPN